MGGIRRRAQRSHKQDEAGAAEAAPAGEVRQAPKRAARCAQGIKPEIPEVLRSIESLYVDKLKPFGRILRKRVAERHVAHSQPQAPGATSDLPDVDIKHLKEVCDGCDALDIAPEEGGDWSATFRGRGQNFVDIYSPVDDFAPDVWQACSQYFALIPEDEALLPGGRYSCAQALVRRNLPFLLGFTLGEVCHLVQLAISKHKILGYCNGAVVPYQRSQSRVKEECAESGQPCQHAPKEDPAPSLSLATLEKAREHLREILANAAVPGAAGPSMIPLSNVKRLFRSRYQVELSETSLGHSKLSELLQDARFADICEVQLQGQGYIVVEADKTRQTEVPTPTRYTGGPIGPTTVDAPESQSTLGSLASLAVDCALTPVLDASKYDGLVMGSAPRRLFCPNEPLEDVLEMSPEPLMALPTPLASPGLATPNTASRWPLYDFWPGAMRESQAYEAFQAWAQGHSCPEEQQGCDSTESTADSQHSQVAAAPQSPAPSSGRGMGGEPPSPQPEDVPLKVELSILQRMQTTPDFEEEEEARARIPFCVGEPLALEEAGFGELPPGLPAENQVKNTFIHSAVTPLVTPEPGSFRRSQSVPKDVGFAAGMAQMLPSSHETNCASVVPSPAFLPPPTPSSPLYSRGYEAMLLPHLERSNVIRLADLI